MSVAPPRWRVLLKARVEKKWDSFSWTTLRALVSSINDTLNAGAPRLVGDIRAAWIAEVGSPAIIDRTADTSFVVVGDPGEQDASQFVVAPALEDAFAKKQDGPSFMVICSDVIYPSGDVNDYVDGFYVPYEGVRVGGAPAPAYALPGNHDWYDGLTGFMWHFCQQSPLSTTVYGGPEDGLVEWVFRLLWRRPSKLRPQLGLEDRRSARFPNGPLQHSPYFAIDTKHLRVVCIDTGITGEVDAEQARWLLEVSADGDDETPARPKLLLTGKPLLVDRVWKRGKFADTVTDGTHEFDTVDSIVRHSAHGYVAAIGGDIHNFQHYELPAGEESFHYIVSGGGGAYTSATHQLAVVGGDAPAPARLFPDEEDSLRHFARKLLPRLWRLVRALGLAIAGLWLASLWIHHSDRATILDVLTGLALGLGAWLVLRSALSARARAHPAFRFFVCVAAIAAGVLAGLTGWWLAPDRFDRNLEVWTGLIAGGSLLALLLRGTHWWRPRVPGLSARPGWGGVLLLASIVVTIVAWREDPALGFAALGTTLIGVATTILRALDVWTAVAALVVAFVVQLGDALVILKVFTVPDQAEEAFWAAVLAVPAGLLVVGLVSFVVLPVLTRIVVVVGPARELWGRLGGPAQAVLPFLAGGALAGLGLWLHGQVERDTWRAAMVAGALPLVVIGAAFLTDWSRRHNRWSFSGVDLVAIVAAVLAVRHATDLDDLPLAAAGVVAFLVLGVLRKLLRSASYKLELLVLAGAALTVLWSVGAHETWIPRAAAAGTLVLALIVLGVVTVHLVFIGAPTMLVDPHTWGDREQFTRPEAAAVLAWRGGAGRPSGWRVRLRANIVFPGADRPHGPLQEKVSEIFDADEPPFAKHFLVVDSSHDQLTIRVVPVTGTEPEPTPVTIPIPLSSDPAGGDSLPPKGG